MRVLTVVGARPQFIKAAPVSATLRRVATEFLLHTGQHYDDAMSELFFRQLGIPEPDVNLGVGSGPQGAQTAAMLTGIEAAIDAQSPDLVLVYGDTNSTLAGALAATKCHVPVAHVEAGLRSFDRAMPEEINRLVADHVADLLLCPTEAAAANLRREGLVDGVHVVGDVMYDAYLRHAAIARTATDILRRKGLKPGGFHLLTVHRPHNVDRIENLESILRGVGESGVKVVFPAHPRTRSALARVQSMPSNVELIEPVGYLEMLVLEENAQAIVTDSGGVQKEAYFAGRPCITLRAQTEWVETVELGWNVLVGTDPAAIAKAMTSFRPSGPRPRLFGDGHAAELVVKVLMAAADRIR